MNTKGFVGIFGVVVAVLIILIGISFFWIQQTVPESEVTKESVLLEVEEPVSPVNTDIQASFAIFTNGTFRIFTAAMYHNLSQDVYIESENPNKVYVKKTGVTWQDFFSTLPFKLTAECLTTGTKETFCTGPKGELDFYINGMKDANVLTQEIKNGDKLLVTFGANSQEIINQQISRIP